MEAILELHGGALRSLARRFLHDEHEAEDAVQQAAVQFLVKGHGIRDRGKAAAWMRAVVTHLSVRRGRNRLKYGEAPDSLPDGSPGPDDLAAASEAGPSLDRLLGSLVPRQRTALRLRVLDGMGYAEVAEAMGVRVSAVRALVHRAREALRWRAWEMPDAPGR